jgi:hypothetical protein
MNFESIKQNLANIDYAWNKLETYVVFIPGLSLVVQKIQLAAVLPWINGEVINPQNADQANLKSRKFLNICKWHLRGSMVQIMVSLIAIKLFALPTFSWVSLLATYEMVDTLAKGIINRVTLYEFYPSGKLKKMTSVSACNIF